MALRYYFDLVCPYSYILAHEVEEAEDERLVEEVEWLPFELRPAPAALPEPRSEYIRDHVYGIAQNHGVDIHVPPTSPAPRSPWRSTPSPKKRDAGGRPARQRTTPSLSRSRTWAARGCCAASPGKVCALLAGW
jgi:hypothetical protein